MEIIELNFRKARKAPVTNDSDAFTLPVSAGVSMDAFLEAMNAIRAMNERESHIAIRGKPVIVWDSISEPPRK